MHFCERRGPKVSKEDTEDCQDTWRIPGHSPKLDKTPPPHHSDQSSVPPHHIHCSNTVIAGVTFISLTWWEGDSLTPQDRRHCLQDKQQCWLAGLGGLGARSSAILSLCYCVITISSKYRNTSLAAPDTFKIQKSIQHLERGLSLDFDPPFLNRFFFIPTVLL